MTIAPLTSAESTDAGQHENPQSVAILDFLRRYQSAPLLAGHDGEPRDAIDALWHRLFDGILDAPAWQPSPLGEHFERPVTVLNAPFPGYPGLILVAACTALAADHAVTLAALRPCPADGAHHNVVDVQNRRDLARALHLSAVGGRIDHGDCYPTHGSAVEIFRMNRADEQRSADRARAQADLPTAREALLVLPVPDEQQAAGTESL